jgi:hypothetical protein
MVWMCCQTNNVLLKLQNVAHIVVIIEKLAYSSIQFNFYILEFC